jgi:hypothetical protein
VNFKTQKNFCDSKVTDIKLNKKCPRCNLNLKSHLCEKLHRSLCYGVGHFGWYCDKCKHFTYKTENLSSEQIKNLHQCGVTICRLCRKSYNSQSESIHLCPLRIEKATKTWPHLAFLNIEFLDYNVENCSHCFEIKNDFRLQNNLSWKNVFENENFPNLFCDLHIGNEIFINPLLFIIYKEHSVNKGKFERHIISDYDVNKKCENVLDVNYLKNTQDFSKFNQKKRLTLNQKRIKEDLLSKTSLIAQFLSLILNEEWSNTTFVIQDMDSFKMVNKTVKIIFIFNISL